MKYVLIILGLILALYGFNFLTRYIKLMRSSVRVAGRIVDNVKREQTQKLPAGWAPIAEYEVNGKIVRGTSELPAAQRYAVGYQVGLYYKKKEPTSFVLAAFLSSMKIYFCVLLPGGLALAAWGISMFF